MNASRIKWSLSGLAVTVAIVLAAECGVQLVGQFQNGQQTAHANITGPATSQPFDERLSLRMPVAFGSPTEFPLEKLPIGLRGTVQRMIQRTAYFNGVYVVVMKVTNTPGNEGKIENSLDNTFSRNVNPPSSIRPKISWTHVNGGQESGAIRFAASFGRTQGEMTAVVIKSDGEDAFWCINAWGTGKAADEAEKTAKEFAFK
jgi:hypothetical protein